MVKKLRINESAYTQEERSRDACTQLIIDLNNRLNYIKGYTNQIEREYKPISLKLDKLISNDLGVIDVEKANYLVSALKPICKYLEDVIYDISKVAEHSDPRFKEAEFIMSELQD